MKTRLLHLFTTGILLIAGAGSAVAQSSGFPGSGESQNDDRPKSFKETLVKMQIDKEKKEFEQMLGRGEEALKLSEELEKAYSFNGKLNPNEINKLTAIEKLVKKIRSDLGGDDEADDDERENERTRTPQVSLPQAEAVKSFRSNTLRLLEELKKTTRFTISAAAIQASNSVLKLTRFLRLSR